MIRTVVAVAAGLAACSGDHPSLEWAVTEAPCGGAHQDDCPLESWMESTLSSALQESDAPALARGFAHLDLDLPGEPRWRPLVRAGLEAAQHGDLEAVRKVCKDCHDGVRDRFRRDLAGHYVRAAR